MVLDSCGELVQDAHVVTELLWLFVQRRELEALLLILGGKFAKSEGFWDELRRLRLLRGFVTLTGPSKFLIVVVYVFEEGSTPLHVHYTYLFEQALAVLGYLLWIFEKDCVLCFYFNL